MYMHRKSYDINKNGQKKINRSTLTAKIKLANVCLLDAIFEYLSFYDFSKYSKSFALWDRSEMFS